MRWGQLPRFGAWLMVKGGGGVLLCSEIIKQATCREKKKIVITYLRTYVQPCTGSFAWGCTRDESKTVWSRNRHWGNCRDHRGNRYQLLGWEAQSKQDCICRQWKFLTDISYFPTRTEVNKSYFPTRTEVNKSVKIYHSQCKTVYFIVSNLEIQKEYSAPY